MPIFEFLCEDCQKPFEKLVLSSESAVKECLHCGGSNIKKLFSSFALSMAAPRSSSPGPMAAGPNCGRCGSDTPCGA